MVTRYNVKSSRWSRHLWWKMRVCLLFFDEKCKNCQQKAAKCLIMSYSTCQYQKFPIFNVFWLFLIFGKIQDGVQNGGHLGWRRRSPAALQPIRCTSFFWAHQRLPTKGEIFPKYCNITKTQGGLHQPPPPPSLYHGGGVTLLVRPRVKYSTKIKQKLMPDNRYLTSSVNSSTSAWSGSRAIQLDNNTTSAVNNPVTITSRWRSLMACDNRKEKMKTFNIWYGKKTSPAACQSSWFHY